MTHRAIVVLFFLSGHGGTPQLRYDYFYLVSFVFRRGFLRLTQLTLTSTIFHFMVSSQYKTTAVSSDGFCISVVAFNGRGKFRSD